MTNEEFVEKYKDYTGDIIDGVEFENEEILDLCDDYFQHWIQVPDFKYQQLKNKFGTARVYCDNVNTYDLEEEINVILKKEYDDYKNKQSDISLPRT